MNLTKWLLFFCSAAAVKDLATSIETKWRKLLPAENAAAVKTEEGASSLLGMTILLTKEKIPYRPNRRCGEKAQDRGVRVKVRAAS